MSSKKIYDLTVKTGEYTNREGVTKGNYLNIGALMQKDDGGKFIIMNRTFNPAGVPNPDNRDTIMVSMFKKDDGQPQVENGHNVNGSMANTTQGKPQIDDDIPF